MRSMRIFNKFRDTRGFVSLWQQTIRFRYMITEKAKERIRILAFWGRHGEAATTEAFKVSRRTLYRWQAVLKKSRGKIERLNATSTAPKESRRRIVPDAVKSRIIELRMTHPRLGKNKIQPLLIQAGYTLSASTVGRMLTDLKRQGQLPNPIRLSFQGKTGNLTERIRKRKKKLRRPHGYRVLEVDTVVRFVDGMKRYILTGVDTERRTAFAACYTNHGSQSAADFLNKTQTVLPDCPSAVQTDNGSEFALHFERAASSSGLTHFHTYPRSPTMNAHVERFNRTLEEEFLKQHRALLRDDVAAFNNALIDWLLWYNGERPHHALGQVAPLRFMMQSLPREKCQMWWTHTRN